MTLQNLIDWCKEHGVPLDTPIAIRDKDDFLLVKENIRADGDPPYFGNCQYGDDYVAAIAPRDENGDIDYDSRDFPVFLILGTGY